jgi:hypothetical protein
MGSADFGSKVVGSNPIIDLCLARKKSVVFVMLVSSSEVVGHTCRSMLPILVSLGHWERCPHNRIDLTPEI